MNDDLNRPNPEALLEAGQRAERGRFRLFLGASPGVGKTCAMLKAAHDRKAEGVDVVVGIVETHGRSETQALIEGLPVIPRKSLIYKDRAFAEMDIDAILDRNPALVLVDELAHTNIAGSRHPKRYQDVMELLDSGIDVYSTLNIQHLESLNDTIQQITGVVVRETIPDAALKCVDEIALIDIPPTELKKRLAEGKVYMPEQATRAVSSFFSDGNLTALRELAFRFAAATVDAEMLSYLQVHGIEAPTPSFDRIMGLISGSDGAEQLVRLCAQMAERRQAKWLVIHVETPANKEAGREQALSKAFQLAESLGGETLTVYGTNIAVEALRLARARNITRIIVGRSRKPLWYRRLIEPSVATRLLTSGGQFEVLVAPLLTKKETPFKSATAFIQPQFLIGPCLAALCFTGIATFMGFMLDALLPLPNLAFPYVAAVALSAYLGGLFPSLVATTASFLSYNFFFMEPRYTFTIQDRSNVVTIVFFLLVSIVVSNVALRLKRQVQAVQAYARRTENLYALSRKLASSLEADSVATSVVEQVHASLEIQTAFFMGSHDKLGIIPIDALPQKTLLSTVEAGAAEWAFNKGEVTGYASATLPASNWLFMPLLGKDEKVLAVLGVVPKSQRQGIFDGDERRFLDAVCQHSALALERISLTQHVAETRVYTATERFRTALLSSVSHDLRTPLASITGSASSLLEYDDHLPVDQRQNLLHTILEESGRLNRFIENLLSITKVGMGALKPNFDWIEVQDLVNSCIKRFEISLKKRLLVLTLPNDVPLLYGDFVLLEQVFVNILDNALKYTPEGSKIYFRVAVKEQSFVFDIQDEGTGIANDKLQDVFNLFTRFESGDRKVGGSGLGLSIAKGIVEAHGGRIQLFNNNGLCVQIIIPCKDHRRSK